MQLAAVVARGLTILATLSFTACGGETNRTGPSLPANPPENPQLTRAAFTFNVNMQTREITVRVPSMTMGPSGPALSLIAGDAITLNASNYFASSVGQFTPGKIRVRFDVSITNKLTGVQLITPTFPTAPPGVSGVLLVPFATYVTATSGGISAIGSGDSALVGLPDAGQVAPSVDWDGDGSAGSGAPFNLFNDVVCPTASNDCYRYDAYTAPVASGATTVSRTVGFDVDPAVANFSAKVIVAADLQNSGP